MPPIGGARAGILAGGNQIAVNLIDNYEDADATPAGPYGSGDTIDTYYTVTNGSFERSTTNAIDGSFSIARNSASGTNDSDAAVSLPGDGLPNYPDEGESVSAIVDDPANLFPGVMSAVPSAEVKGYTGLYAFGEVFLRRHDGSGSVTDLNSTTVSASLPYEIVVKPPATGGSTVEMSVFELNPDLSRLSRIANFSETDSTYAGEQGIGMIAANDSNTGLVGDNLRIGRSLV